LCKRYRDFFWNKFRFIQNQLRGDFPLYRTSSFYLKVEGGYEMPRISQLWNSRPSESGLADSEAGFMEENPAFPDEPESSFFTRLMVISSRDQGKKKSELL
jgi:hypothetical protein